jgi:hypothetical protein
MVPLEEVVTTVREKIAELEAEIRSTLQIETAKDGTFAGVEKPVHPSRDDLGSSCLRRDTGSVRAPK